MPEALSTIILFSCALVHYGAGPPLRPDESLARQKISGCSSGMKPAAGHGPSGTMAANRCV